MNHTDKQTLKSALEKWGADAQVHMFMEEVGELMSAIGKDYRGRTSNVLEEIADVEIMLEQMKILFHCDEDQIEFIKGQKMNRLRERLWTNDRT